MNFGQALEALKDGCRVARAGWNGKGMWVKIVDYAPPIILNNATEDNGSLHTYLEPFFVIRGTRQTGLNTWVPSVSDVLAEDWEVLK